MFLRSSASGRKKLRALKEQGKNPFEIVKFDRTADSKEILDHFEELEGSEAAIAGRIISKRVMGKASFSILWTERENSVLCPPGCDGRRALCPV